MTDTPAGTRSFFKYAAPETALAVLRNKTVRYSSPLTFNDPFDFQSGLHFDFNLDTLYAKVLDRLEELAATKEEPVVDAQDPCGKLVLLVREKYPARGFPRERWEKMIAPLFANLVQEIRSAQRKYQEHWWNTLLPGIRVFCVSEERGNLLMWAHYAKDHTGVVFEYKSFPDEDNPLSVAQPVIYVDRPPPFFTETEWIEDILSIQRMDEHELSKRYAYIKSGHWRYEREWRVWYPLIPAPDSLHFDCPIRPSEFMGVDIGCRAEPKFTTEVIELTRNAFPHVRIHRAHKKRGDYALEYEQI